MPLPAPPPAFPTPPAPAEAPAPTPFAPAPVASPADAERAGARKPAGSWRRRFAPVQLAGRSVSGRQIGFGLLLGFCLTPWASPPLALALGLLLAQTLGNPYPRQTRALTARLLQFSVVGLGFGLNAHAAAQAGRQGLLFTVCSLAGTLLLGYAGGRALGLNRRLAHLIACGTAICGGSAIAAVGPVLKAKEEEMSAALGTVFVLNALALFAFPPLGHALALSQPQFGLWCAIAIHDTSSVVGAAAAYGDEALRLATAVKLARALWIVPVALGTALVFRQKGVKVQVPYFILGFLAALLLNTYVPAAQALAPALVRLAKLGLTLTLFLIGTGLSAPLVRAVGPRPFLLGAGLWLAVSAVSLYVIRLAG